MAIRLKVLRISALASSLSGTSTLLTSGTKSWLIKSICFHNNQASAITLDLTAAAAGGTTVYIYKNYSIAAGAELVIEKEIALNMSGTADTLTAKVYNSSSLTLDCVIDGLERDV